MSRLKVYSKLGTTQIQQGVLVLILLVALGFRLWGIGFGLPYLYHPDEAALISPAIHTVQTGDWSPHFFHYPSFFHHSLAFLYIAYFVLGVSAGTFTSVQDLSSPQMVALGTGQIDYPSEVLVGRLISAVSSLVVVFVVYKIGLLNGKRTGLLAAASVTISPTLVYLSHWVTVDMTGIAWVAISLLFAIQIAYNPKWTGYIFGGIAAGLAAATKYPLILVAVGLVSAHCISHPVKQWLNRKLLIGITLVPITFLVMTPYVFLELPDFLNGLAFSIAHYSRLGHAGMEGNSLQWYLSYIIRQEGLLPFLSLPALIWAIHTKNKVGVVLSVTSAVYFTLIARQLVRNDRTLAPIIPILIILGSMFAVACFKMLHKHIGQRYGKATYILTGLTLSLLIIIPLWNSVKYNFLLSQEDGRDKARIWLETNVAPGSKIVLENYTPFLDSSRYEVTYIGPLEQNSPDWYQQEGFDYIVFSSAAHGRFYSDPERYASQVESYNKLFAEFPPIQEFSGGFTTIKISQIQ